MRAVAAFLAANAAPDDVETAIRLEREFACTDAQPAHGPRFARRDRRLGSRGYHEGYAGARTVCVNLEPMTPPNPAFREVLLGRAENLLPRLFADVDGASPK